MHRLERVRLVHHPCCIAHQPSLNLLHRGHGTGEARLALAAQDLLCGLDRLRRARARLRRPRRLRQRVHTFRRRARQAGPLALALTFSTLTLTFNPYDHPILTLTLTHASSTLSRQAGHRPVGRAAAQGRSDHRRPGHVCVGRVRLHHRHDCAARGADGRANLLRSRPCCDDVGHSLADVPAPPHLAQHEVGVSCSTLSLFCHSALFPSARAFLLRPSTKCLPHLISATRIQPESHTPLHRPSRGSSTPLSSSRWARGPLLTCSTSSSAIGCRSSAVIAFTRTPYTHTRARERYSAHMCTPRIRMHTHARTSQL